MSGLERNKFFFSNILSGLIVLVSSILLARVYTPEEYGIYYNILFTGSILSLFFSLNSETLLPYVSQKKILLGLLILVAGTSFIFSIILLAIIQKKSIALGIMLASGITFNKANIMYKISERNYGNTGKIKLQMSLMQVSTKYFGKAIFGLDSLIVGDMIQNIFLFKRTLLKPIKLSCIKKLIQILIKKNHVLLKNTLGMEFRKL
jgi:hypothetical protein